MMLLVGDLSCNLNSFYLNSVGSYFVESKKIKWEKIKRWAERVGDAVAAFQMGENANKCDVLRIWANIGEVQIDMRLRAIEDFLDTFPYSMSREISLTAFAVD